MKTSSPNQIRDRIKLEIRIRIRIKMETRRINGIRDANLNSLVIPHKKSSHHLGTACFVELPYSRSPSTSDHSTSFRRSSVACLIVDVELSSSISDFPSMLIPVPSSPLKKDSVLRICIHINANTVYKGGRGAVEKRKADGAVR